MGAAAVAPVGATQIASAEATGFGAGGYGDGQYGHGDGGGDSENGNPAASQLAVETGETNVEEHTVVLTGHLTELEGYDEAFVSFEWGISGDGLTDTTDRDSRETPGEFSAELSVEPDTSYEYRAVATTNGTEATGETSTFSTPRLDDESGSEDEEFLVEEGDKDDHTDDHDGSDENPEASPTIHTLHAADISHPSDDYMDVSIVWGASITDGTLSHAALAVLSPNELLLEYEYDLDSDASSHSELDRVPIDPDWDNCQEFTVELTVESGHDTNTTDETTFISVNTPDPDGNERPEH